MTTGVAIVVALLAIVQSVFGVGLLVFGTPSLLLMGLPFTHAIGILLPASLAVSLLQMRHGPRQDSRFGRQFALWCLAPLVLTMTFVLLTGSRIALNAMIASILAAFAILRSSASLRGKVSSFVKKRTSTFLVVVGVVHGASNLGGGLVTVLAASMHDKKEDVRGVVAFCYAQLAVIQLLVLGWLSPEVFGWHQLGAAAISSSAFILLGRAVFALISARTFDHLLTGLLASFSALLFAMSAGLF